MHTTAYETIQCTFGHIRKICEKSLSVHGDCGDFRVDLDGQSRLRIRQKYFSVNEEYAKSA